MSVYGSALALLRRMTAGRSSFVSIAVITLAGALLSACSLAAPAPVGQAGSQVPIAQPPPAQLIELPTRKPAATEGLAVYQQKCVRCHGAQGRGDGQMARQIQSQFGKPVADLTSDAIARAQTPEAWYLQITNGSLQSGMPPFAALEVNQRWDVIAYAWTLAAPSAQIARGQAVYTRQCVQCHGQTGQGDGPDAPGKLPDFSRFATFATIEAGRLDQALASTHIPSFAGTTSESERRAAIDYLRTFAYDFSTKSPSSEAAPSSSGSITLPTTAAGPNASGAVSGQILNGTAGQPVPPSWPVLFEHASSDTSAVISQTVQADALGRFTISATQLASGDLMRASVHYDEIDYFSPVITYGSHATLPITIYERTTDTSHIGIDVLHIIAAPTADGLQVNELYVLSNNSDRIVADPGKPTVHLGLPAGATQFSADPGMPSNTVEMGGDGLDYFGEVPARSAGTATVAYSYRLPGTSNVLDRPIFQRIGVVNVLVQSDPQTSRVTGQPFTPAGVQDFQGQTYQVLQAVDLTSGQTLALKVEPASTPFDWRSGLGVGLVVIGIVGIVLWRRSRGPGPATDSPKAQRDLLIDQIAALDDEFAAGRMDEVNYTAKRARLKKRLLKLM